MENDDWMMKEVVRQIKEAIDETNANHSHTGFKAWYPESVELSSDGNTRTYIFPS